MKLNKDIAKECKIVSRGTVHTLYMNRPDLLTINLHDMSGHKITKILDQNKKRIKKIGFDLSNYSNGVYIVNVVTTNNKMNMLIKNIK